MYALRIKLAPWGACCVLVVLLVVCGRLLGDKCQRNHAVRLDGDPGRCSHIWLNVAGLKTGSHAGATNGLFTYDPSSGRLHRNTRFAQRRVRSVARNGSTACAVTREFTGHGYSTTVILYCVDSGGEMQRLDLSARTGSYVAAALSADGTRLAVAYVGGPSAGHTEPFSAWQGWFEVYDLSDKRFVLSRRVRWPKPMDVDTDRAIKWLRWAPDGKSLVCEQDRKIWGIAADLSEAHNLGPGKGACWSPDGRLLAIADWEGTLVIRDAGGAVVLQKRIDVHSGGMAWLDNQSIALAKREYPAFGKPRARLCILDISNGRISKTGVIAHSIAIIGIIAGR